MKKKVLLAMLSCMLMISAIPANVFADNTDPGPANTATTMDQAGSSATSVYADINSSYVVTLPKTIKLDSTTKDAQYTVNVKGALAGTEIIKVIPDTSFTMKQDGKDDVTATVTQAKTDFTSAELAADTENGVTETGTVAAPDISAGRWDGSFNFNVSKSMVSGLYKSDGSYVTWQSLLDGGTFTVTDGTLTSDIDKVSALSGDLYVDESVTALGTQAFSKATGLTKLVLPDTLTSIGNSAFVNCSFPELVIPASVTTFGENSFSSASISTVIINSSGETFNSKFGGSYIENLIFNGSYKTISDLVGCFQLKYVCLPKNLETMPTCSGTDTMETIVVNSKIKSFGSSGTLSSCKALKTLDLSGTEITEMPPSAFSGCSALTEVKLPSTLQSIGGGAFYDCAALEDLVVPDSVTTITTDAFKNVKHVTYHGTAVAAEDNANWGAVALN